MAITRRYNVELSPDSFKRLDETDDSVFYATFDPSANYVRAALAAVRPVIRTLVTDPEPAILDLVAGSNSYIAGIVEPSRLVGIGLTEQAMAANTNLSERISHDLNADPNLPFEDASFDVVLSTGSVPYLTRPIEVFAEVARVLKPGGLMLVIFDNRLDERRVGKIWRRSSEEERLALVDHCFGRTGAFDRPQVRLTRARSRPGVHADGDDEAGRVFYAIFAGRVGGQVADNRDALLQPMVEHRYTPEEIAERRQQVGETMCCPYCDTPLTRFKVPDVPFCEWDAEYLWVCFADDCPFTLRSLAVMREQGNLGVSYRVVYHQGRNKVYTVPDASFCDAG